MRYMWHQPQGGTSQGFWFPSLELDVHSFLISKEQEGDPIMEEFDVQNVNGGPPIERFLIFYFLSFHNNFVHAFQEQINYVNIFWNILKDRELFVYSYQHTQHNN